MLGGRRYKIIRELLDGEWTNGVAAYEDRDDLVVTPKVFDALEDARADGAHTANSLICLKNQNDRE